MTINWQQKRADFPILKQQINGQPLVYFDHAATSQKPKQVLEAIQTYYEEANANVYRSVHTLSGMATEKYENARETVQNFIQAESREEIVFTSGTTESLNLVARMLATELEPGDEILLTYMEHHSNIVPWQEIAQEKDAKLVYVQLTEDARLDLTDYQNKINERTKIIAFSHVSNVTGVMNPVRKMVAMARSHNQHPYIIVDGAQATGHLPVNVVDLDVDFYVFSGHKMLGPTGIGVLYGKKSLLHRLKPEKFGGEMIEQVQEQTSTWAALPHKYEAGTPNIAGAIGLAAAIDYLEQIGLDTIRQREESLTRYLLDQLAAISGLTIYGPITTEKRAAVVAFNLGNIHPHDVATGLDLDGIAIRAGHHCAQLLQKKLGIFASSRISLSFYNTQEEIDRAIVSLQQVKEFFNDET